MTKKVWSIELSRVKLRMDGRAEKCWVNVVRQQSREDKLQFIGMCGEQLHLDNRWSISLDINDDVASGFPWACGLL